MKLSFAIAALISTTAATTAAEWAACTDSKDCAAGACGAVLASSAPDFTDLKQADVDAYKKVFDLTKSSDEFKLKAAMVKADADKIGSWWMGQMSGKKFCVADTQCNKVWPADGKVVFTCTPTGKKAAAPKSEEGARGTGVINGACDRTATGSGCVEGACCAKADTGQKFGETEVTDDWLKANTKSSCQSADASEFTHPVGK